MEGLLQLSGDRGASDDLAPVVSQAAAMQNNQFAAVTPFGVAWPGPLRCTHTRGQRPERQGLGGPEETDLPLVSTRREHRGARAPPLASCGAGPRCATLVGPPAGPLAQQIRRPLGSERPPQVQPHVDCDDFEFLSYWLLTRLCD